MISNTVLVLAGALGKSLDAERVTGAFAGGLTAGGHIEADRCPLTERLDKRMTDPSVPLENVGFNQRMRAARALVIVCAKLDNPLAGTLAFEAATRARQSGVPAYAVTAENALDPFEARIVDLQVILQADGSRALGAAGRKLAALV